MPPGPTSRTPTPTGGRRWIGSLLGLAALVLGIPLALVSFHAVPPLEEVGRILFHPGDAGRYLDRSLSDSAVAKTVAAAAWIAWAWLVMCVAVEIVGAVRGRPTLHLPASRHIQSLVATLVGASLTVVPLGRDVLPMRLHAAPAAIHQTFGSDTATVRNGYVSDTLRDASALRDGPLRLGAVGADDETSPETTGPLYLVKAGDTLWSIAQQELGSPLRWQEIAQLNYGRVQPDGNELTDAHWIFPGWELVLPSSPMANEAAAVERFRAVTVAPPLPVVDSPVLSASSSGPAPASARPGARSDTGSSASDRREPPPTDTGSDVERHSRSPVPFGVISYGILGAGVIMLLERMRRVQRRYRSDGLRIALPDGDLAVLERRLRVEADSDAVDVIDLGLRALVVHSLRSGEMPPPATVVRLGHDALEVILDPSAPDRVPPAPFTSDPAAGSWLLSRDHSTMHGLRTDPDITGTDAPFPALVTIGRDGSGEVLVDVEQAASIDIDGDADGILGTIAVEMATAHWADQLELILVGFDHELESLDRVSHVGSIAEVVSKVRRRVRERHALLASVGRDANWEIRWLEGGDAWDLCVVLCARRAVEIDRHGADELVQIAGPGGLGLAVVLGSPTGVARWHLGAHEGRIELTTSGSTTSTFRPPPAESHLSTAASLVRVASQRDGVLPSEPPYDKLIEDDQERPVTGELEALGSDVTLEDLMMEDPGPGAVDGPDDPDDADVMEVEVRVLGPVEIVGAARPFARAWAVELVVYLAMHARGASSEQWATALWPDRIMAAASLHSTASAARRSLGVARSGEDHLPRAHGRLSLGAGVTSDWSRFVALSGRNEPESWQEALELIRGRPFDGLRAPDWVLLEGIAANVEAIVVDLASRYAEHCLAAGDPSGAEWSARQGLLVSAYDERLYRILLRAADAAGNPAGVESVMSELVRLVAEDVEPDDAVHPETLVVYRALSRRSAPSVNR
jgi:DNA-binding SARP family transcriptional activator